jgi:hypothetical protein
MKCFVSLASAIEELANVNSQNITAKITHSLQNIIFNHQSISLTSFKFSNIKHKQLEKETIRYQYYNTFLFVATSKS